MTLDIKNWKNCFPFPEPREDQEKCIQFALEQFFIHDKDYVVIEAGLGIGKSAIGMTIANFFNSHLQEVEQLPTADPEEFAAGSYTLTSQKILQEQYLRDFSDAPCELRTIISSANFSCSGRPGSTCADSLRVYSALKGKFPAAPQKHCKQFCPYKQQKREFLQGLNGITNYPYFLAETMYAGQLKPRNLLVVDECLRGNAKIWIDDDKEVSIKEIYQNENITHVISYNQEKNVYEKKKILRKIRTEYDKNTEWIEIVLSVEGKKTKLLTTANHKIWTLNRGYVRADQLTKIDILKFDLQPKTNLGNHYGHFKRAETVRQKKQIKYVCQSCNKYYNNHHFQMHLNRIIEVRKCLNENCNKKIEITKSNAPQRFCSHKCYGQSEITRTSRSKHMMSNNPMFDDKNVIEMKKSWKTQWDNKSEDEKLKQITRFKNAPLHENRNGPNKLEKFILDLKIPSVKFTGLGEKWVTFKNGKRKNPDFIIEDTRKVIEIGDVYFWHSEEEIQNTIKQYSDIGYECLYVTNKQINEDRDAVIANINKFVYNHDVVIASVRKLESVRNFSKKSKHYKYNIEVEDNHNYFANSILVSNCHNIESAVGKFVELRITEKFAKSVLNLNIPSTKKIDDMFEWLSKKYEPALQKCIKKLVKDIEKADESKAVEYSKKLETLDKHICKIHRLQKTWSPLNWIINVDDSSGLFWDFKPVDVSLWTEDLLFRFGKKKLLLSATILDYDYYCKSTGIPKDKTAFISIDSPFKPANKPIIYVPTGKMSYAEIDKTLPHLADMVREILKSHQGEKGIIHSVNFRIAEYIMNNVKDSRLLVQKKGMDRNELLQKHVSSSEPTVIVSPSMTEGVDLKDDLSRFQVFCKIPFPVLTDEVVKRKMAARKEFYGYTTAQSIIQAVGRSVRSESDWAVTYILDSCAKDFFRNNSHYFPPSFSNSVMNLGNEKLF